MKNSTTTKSSPYWYTENGKHIIPHDHSNIIDLKKYYDSDILSHFLIDSNIERLRDVIIDDEQFEKKDDKIQDIVNSNHDEVIYYQNKILNELEKSREEHENLKEQITILSSKVAEKEDTIAAKDQIISQISSEAQEIKDLTIKKTTELKNALEGFLPHKRTLRVSLYFLTLFSACLFATLFFGIVIIDPFWNFLGISVSCGFVLLSIALHKDWKKCEKS